MTVTADEVTDAGAAQVDWGHIAREMADDLATDAAEREQAGKAPLDEVARLRESGLLTLLVPAEHGGGGADWRTAYTVVRTVAAADGASATCWATTVLRRPHPSSSTPPAPGVVSGSGGDTFGQRLAAGGVVEFDSVAVADDDVLGSLSPDEGVLVWRGRGPAGRGS